MEKAQITLRLPLELLEQLRRQAQARGDSLNGTIIRHLWAAVSVTQPETANDRYPPATEPPQCESARSGPRIDGSPPA